MQHQDWKPVVLRGGKMAPKKKYVAQKNKGLEKSSKNKKLDESTEAKKIEYISPKIKQQLINGRVAKKWKQKDLANAMSIPVKRIQEIESGKAVNNMAYFQKIARKLGIKLEK